MDNETKDVEVLDNQTTETEEKDVQENKTVDVKEITKKLQKRIGNEQQKRHSLEKENADLKKRLEEVEKGSKSIKELSDEERSKQAENEKDKRIQELELKIARNEALQQTKQVLDESGLNVPNDVLNLIVANDNKQTIANVTTISNFIEKIREETRKELLSGKTPKVLGTSPTTMTKEEIMNIKDATERQKLMRENWSLFQ